jgi:HSP20 family protein
MLAKINRKSELSPSLRSFDDMFSAMLKQFDPFYNLENPFENHAPGHMELDIKDDSIIARLPLPGCKRENISIEIENDILTIKAAKNCCCNDKEIKEKLIRHERHYESFEESIKLPSAIDAKKSEAIYKHGILTVKMEKSKSEKDDVHIIKIN